MNALELHDAILDASLCKLMNALYLAASALGKRRTFELIASEARLEAQLMANADVVERALQQFTSAHAK